MKEGAIPLVRGDVLYKTQLRKVYKSSNCESWVEM